LLYPSNGYRFDHAFTLHNNHRIRISTIDLQQPWADIETELFGLFCGSESSEFGCGKSC
jgi:hypothetical protein